MRTAKASNNKVRLLLVTVIIGVVAIFLSMGQKTNAAESKYSLRYVNAAYSYQELNYIIYLPNNVSAATPIFLFLHGDVDVGCSYTTIVKHYQFLQRLKDGSWQPNFILVMPIGRKTCNWAAEADNVNYILQEVVSVFGGSYDNMYIGGASAGADGITPIAQNIPFKGALYLAGHLNGKKGKTSVDKVLSTWTGRFVVYYRDNLHKKGGYGYNPDFVAAMSANAPYYGVTFAMIDLNWNHDYGLVDRVFLPAMYQDAKGQNGLDAITNLIYVYGK